MTYLELTREIKALPRSKRIELMALIKETLQAEEQPRAQTGSSLDLLRGIAKPDGPAPTDEEIDRLREQYLLEKYT